MVFSELDYHVQKEDAGKVVNDIVPLLGAGGQEIVLTSTLLTVHRK